MRLKLSLSVGWCLLFAAACGGNAGPQSATGSGGAGGGASTGAGAVGGGGGSGQGGAGGASLGAGGVGGSGGGATGPEKVPPAPDYDDVGIQVSPAGSDSTGDGTEAKPYKTIMHVVTNVAQPGDTIILREGEYHEAVRIRKPNITIRSHSGEWGVISQPVTQDDNDPMLPMHLDVGAHGSKLQRLEIKGGFYAVTLETSWPEPSGVEDVTIEDSKIHGSGRDCIKVKPKANGFTLRRTEVYDSGIGYPAGTSPDDKNAEGVDVVNADDVLVQDSYIHDTATTGVYVKGGSRNTIVERTRVERAGDMGIALGFDTSPEYFDLAVNPEYYENIDGMVRNCIVKGTRYGGISLYAAKNPTILNNTIIDTAMAGHAPIYFGLTFQDWDPEAGRPANINPTIINNIIAQPDAGDCVAIRFANEAELGGDLPALVGPAVMDNNLYFTATGSCSFSDGRPTAFSGGLPGWASHIGAEASSIEGDPMLSADGHLQAGSAAIGKGRAVEGVSYDIDGDPRAGAYDIGADQL